MLALEILEKILTFCDGRTLLNALDVDEMFKDRVRYLTLNTDIWQHCCKSEIPKNELEEYIQKYGNCDKLTRERWLRLYENWIQWQNIDSNIKMYPSQCPIIAQRITCLSAAGRFIAVGSEDGRVRVFNSKWDPLSFHRFASGKVSDIKYLVGHEEVSKDDILILVAYNCGSTIYITHAIASINRPFIIYHDILTYSTYKNYLCCIRRGGRITIDKILYPFGNGSPKTELTYVRIFNQNEVTTCNIWQGVCTFLLHNEVKTLRYSAKQGSPPNVQHKMFLNFYRNNSVNTKYNYIFRDDIIITLSQDQQYQEVMEVFLMNSDNTLTQKKFPVWNILNAVITYVFLYGNTLVIGDNTGNVSFYEVDSWKKFDLRKRKYIFLGPHPIIYIDAVETLISRVFYIASSSKIHKIECTTLSNYPS